ncbi:Por secretion system C-terminal sorting domain-containing protein [Ekhidna lutea]|uniref:Por secretion system C-terminal sorting domain-containing protein n=1 Tax=Ekhidna lutea TaxID=447679 RepID=A0A239M0S7_EKHLU|nr:FlgD immunoglobulin-like domain containing protein [Ekhidna lutea]SNT35663.1 Por secretion system C-terminal sorting domain-containing protein [Ekhidna lutea]
MKKLFWSVCICLLAGTHEYFSPEYTIEISDEPSEIGGREDLMGRSEYLKMLTADPITGEVPPNIRNAELLFEKKLQYKTAHLRTQQLSIESVGPNNVGGRTRAVAFDVRNEDIILAGGVSGGVWKSTDGGISWVKKSNPENRNSVTCIVQDIRPGHEDTWYHGTGEIVGNSTRGGDAPFRGDGIYKSTDNGESWNPIVSTQDSDPNVFNSQFQYIWNIEINPENQLEDELIVAAFGGILRSVDGGDSWEVVLGQQLFNLDESVDLNEVNASFYTSLERSENNVFYAGLSTETSTDVRSPDAGLYYSLDGQEWIDITPLTKESRYRRVAIGSSPSNPDITYFMLDSNPIFIIEHNLAQMNSSSKVKGFDPNPRVVPNFEAELGDLNTQGSYNMMIKVHPEDQNTVFIGGTNLYRSTDGFRTKGNIKWIGGYDPGGGSGIYPNHHPDQHDLLFLPSNPNTALSASDGGLIQSNDITADSVFWQSRNNGFITSQFFTITQSRQANDPTIIGGMQDNGTDITGGGKIWQGVLGGDGAYAATTKDDLLWFTSFQRGQTLRLTLNEDFKISSFGRVDPGGLVASSGSIYLFVNPFVLDPINQNRMFCAGGNHLYYHPNVSQIPGGSQIPNSTGWIKVNEDPLEDGLVSAIEVSLDGEKVYFGTSAGELFRLDNAGSEVDFQVSAISGPSLPDSAYVSSIAVNPEDPQHILVIFSSYNVPSIFESLDGGQTFADVSGNLEENSDGSGSGPSIRWAEIIPKNSGNLFLVGTSVGLYSTENLNGASTTWIKESANFIGSSIIPMMDYRASDGRLVIATHGNGVFTAEITDFKPITVPTTEPESFQILTTYPNPFLDETSIQFTIPQDGEVRIDILSANGELVNTILWAQQYAGTNSVRWDGTTPSGTSLANGIYFYRIQYQGQSKSGRLLLRR